MVPTPGAANYATPWGGGPQYNAQSHVPAVPAEDWHQVGLAVHIVRDPQTLGSFQGGRFDDERAVITAVNASSTQQQHSGTSAPPGYGPLPPKTVNVRLTGEGRIAPNVTVPPVPLNYVESVSPSASGQKAVVLGGNYRGHTVTTQSRDENAWLVQLDNGATMVLEAALLGILA
jgi:hypothetical protein